MKDHYIGNFENIYQGYSNDKKTRFNSSSGAIVTEILCYLLKQKLIDGAVVIDFDTKKFRPKVIIAKKIEAIKKAMGSKYSIVPLNEIIEKVRGFKGKLAIVGLPCHFKVLKNLEKVDGDFRNKVVLYLGLMCSGASTNDSLDLLRSVVPEKSSDILMVKFRGRGWPGCFYVESKTAKYSIPFHNYFPSVRFFLPKFCLVCNDSFNELADISCGDLWLPEFEKKHSDGFNLVIPRNEKSEKLLKGMQKTGLITLEGLQLQEVINGRQYKNASFKKSNYWLKLFLAGGSKEKLRLTKKQFRDKTEVRYIPRIVLLYIRCRLMKSELIRKHIITPILKKTLIKKMVKDGC